MLKQYNIYKRHKLDKLNKQIDTLEVHKNHYNKTD